MSRMALQWADGTGLMHGIGLINLRQSLVSNYQKGGGGDACSVHAWLAKEQGGRGGVMNIGRGGGGARVSLRCLP
jgi:hypothetical protein